jgi:hypothetical protein
MPKDPFMNKRLWVTTGALWALLHAPAYALDAGSDAQACVQSSQQANAVQLVNGCGAKVFVLWCGELRHTKQRCGEGPKGGFYTHSANLAPGEARKIDVQGRIQWAACAGSIGFGNDRRFEDQGNGAYRCLPR